MDLLKFLLIFYKSLWPTKEKSWKLVTLAATWLRSCAAAATSDLSTVGDQAREEVSQMSQDLCLFGGDQFLELFQELSWCYLYSFLGSCVLFIFESLGNAYIFPKGAPAESWLRACWPLRYAMPLIAPREAGTVPWPNDGKRIEESKRRISFQNETF